jgi:hypothetical protein
MVHRDIKPSNVILTREQEPIVTDYGIARIAGATAYTIPGVVMGSAHYMSPEQAEGLPGDNRSDIYSLGIVLFEALTGSVPFQGETPMSVAIMHVSATPPPALSLNPDLPPPIEAVLAKALAKDPNDRYQQASDLALALKEVFGQAAVEPAAAAAETTTIEEPTVKVTRQMPPPPLSAGEPTRVVEPTVVTEPGPTIPPAPVRRRRAGLSGLPPFVLLAAVAAAAVVFVVPLIVVGAALLSEENGETAAPEVAATGSVQPATSTSTSTQVAPATQVLGGLATPIPTAAAIATPTPPDLSSFAKGWGRHGFGLTIDANGQGSAIWRVYKWCSDDPTPPCDALVGNQIISGGSATLAFDRVDGATAFGRVLSSNNEPMFPLDSEVILMLLPYDMAMLRHGVGYETTLCGPDYANLAPESLFETFPCGA